MFGSCVVMGCLDSVLRVLGFRAVSVVELLMG